MTEKIAHISLGRKIIKINDHENINNLENRIKYSLDDLLETKYSLPDVREKRITNPLCQKRNEITHTSEDPLPFPHGCTDNTGFANIKIRDAKL